MEPSRPRGDTPGPRRRRKPHRRGNKAIIVWAAVGGAVVVAAVAVFLVVHYVRASRTDQRLYGTWKSDADATIAELRTQRPVTAEQEQKLRQLFGKMKITYTATTFTTDMDGTVETEPYEIVKKEATSVML